MKKQNNLLQFKVDALLDMVRPSAQYHTLCGVCARVQGAPSWPPAAAARPPRCRATSDPHTARPATPSLRVACVCCSSTRRPSRARARSSRRRSSTTSA